MAKNSRVPLIETRENQHGTFEPMEDDETNRDPSLEADQDKALEDIVSEFDKGEEGITFTARINRVVGSPRDGVKEPYLFSVDSSMISGVRDKLRDEYGSGTYRIRVYKNNKIHRQFDYQIEAPTKKPLPVGNGGEVQTIVEVMREGNQRQLELMERLILSRSPVVTADPMTLAFGMMEKMSTMIKNMMPTAVAPAAESTGSVDMLVKGIELARDLGGGGEDNSVAGIVKEIVKNPELGKALAGMFAQRRQMGNRPINQPVPQQIQQIVPPQNNGQPDPKSLGDQLQANVRYLIGRAASGRNPELYAEWLLDNTDPSLHGMIVNEPNLLTQLEAQFPRMAQHREWFVSLLEAAKSFIAEDQQGGEGDDEGAGIPDNGPGRDSGNQENPQDHGAGDPPGATGHDNSAVVGRLGAGAGE